MISFTAKWKICPKPFYSAGIYWQLRQALAWQQVAHRDQITAVQRAQGLWGWLHVWFTASLHQLTPVRKTGPATANGKTDEA